MLTSGPWDLERLMDKKRAWSLRLKSSGPPHPMKQQLLDDKTFWIAWCYLGGAIIDCPTQDAQCILARQYEHHIQQVAVGLLSFLLGKKCQ